MIPVLFENGKNIAYVWEQSLVQLYNRGCHIKTQYDKHEDPPSLDCTMLLNITDPLSEPMIHRSMPGGLEDLQEYVMEVCYGIKDDWVRDPSDSEDKRWEYTYHQRLTQYSTPQFSEYHCGKGNFPVNQIEQMCQQLALTPYTRRAQAITWKVWEDPNWESPPCLQSIWCRIIDNELTMNVRIRSNDAFKAGFMNIFAFVQLQCEIAGRISELRQEKIRVGNYCHLVDSYHIYGKDIKEFENRFLKSIRERSFKDRTYNYDEVKSIMDEAIPIILEKVKKQNAVSND